MGSALKTRGSASKGEMLKYVGESVHRVLCVSADGPGHAGGKHLPICQVPNVPALKESMKMGS